MDVEPAVIGVRTLMSDPYVYIYQKKTGFVILALYDLDDIMFLSTSKTMVNKLKK